MISVADDSPMVLDAPMRTVSSLVLGDIAIPSDVILSFPTPLWGFPAHREFALLPAAREGLWWLQSMHDGGITFLLADPFVLDPTYAVDLGETERADLGIEQPSDVLGLVMLTLPTDAGDSATANFRAPLVLNLVRPLGMQVVSRNDAHELRRTVMLDVFPAQPDGIRMA